jgi:hypothetical protein
MIWLRLLIKALRSLPTEVRSVRQLANSCPDCTGGWEPPEQFGRRGPCPSCGGTGKLR